MSVKTHFVFPRQKSIFCLHWSQIAKMGPFGPIWIFYPTGPLWNIDKPIIFGHFLSKMGWPQPWISICGTLLFHISSNTRMWLAETQNTGLLLNLIVHWDICKSWLPLCVSRLSITILVPSPKGQLKVLWKPSFEEYGLIADLVFFQSFLVFRALVLVLGNICTRSLVLGPWSSVPGPWSLVYSSKMQQWSNDTKRCKQLAQDENNPISSLLNLQGFWPCDDSLGGPLSKQQLKNTFDPCAA